MRRQKQWDRERVYRGIARKIIGPVPATKPHSTKKGKKGYQRCSGKAVLVE
ncbi:hypothetical protein HZB94_01335 [Candidatus Falkowbacteria bacterium]|nr:hypothetical protein [Candidatus Falkowbacteria bacterium]